MLQSIVRRAARTAVIVILACTRSERDRARQATTPLDLDGTEWVLLSLAGQPPVAGTRITLEVERDKLGGYNGCNWYGASYQATAATLTIGGVESTARGCGAPGVSEQEQDYHAALGRVHAAHVRDGRLEMADASAQVLLVFTPRERLAQNPDDLVGTSWRLRSASRAPYTPDSTMTLRLAGGSASGFAGCRDFTATYEARADRIYFTSISMAATECNRSEAVLLREQQYTTDLSEATYYRLSGGRLELETADGRVLSFTADPR